MPITVEQVKHKLSTDDRWVERAIVVLFERQTQAEKASRTTLVNNQQGFNAFDAKTGSYMANWILSGNKLSGRYLTRARTMVQKYAIQLTGIAIAKERLATQNTNPK